METVLLHNGNGLHLGLADYVVISPLGKVPSKPDLVLFLCNAEQANNQPWEFIVVTNQPVKEQVYSHAHRTKDDIFRKSNLDTNESQ